MTRDAAWWTAALLLAACGGGAPAPADLDTRNTRCERCQMVVSDRRTAAQVVAPGEEPVFFDDLGCLSGWLKEGKNRLVPETMIYVADHRTMEWIPADRAVYTRAPGLQTPMGSSLTAHATTRSRDEDRSAAGGETVAADELLAGRWRRDGGR